MNSTIHIFDEVITLQPGQHRTDNQVILKYGIEKLKEISGSLVRLGLKVSKRAQNGLNFFEIITTGFDVSSLGSEVYTHFDILKKEVKDLDQAEVAELAVHLMQEFKLPSLTIAYEVIQNIVLKTIDIVYDAIAIYNSSEKLAELLKAA